MSATDRAEWLALRQTGIGGSDAGTVLGVNPYKQSLQLYHEKRGELEADDLSENEAVHFGNTLEDVVAAEFTRRTGLKVQRFNSTLRHPEHPFMIANLDRLVWEGDKKPAHNGEIRTKTLLECKTALGRFTDKTAWGPDGTDEVPETYFMQCMHYLAVTGADVCYLAVLMAGPEFRIYVIRRDEVIIAAIVEAERLFWQQVQDGTPPALDCEHRTAGNLLDRLYPGTDGSTIELPADVEHWHQVRVHSKDQAKQYEAAADAATNHIKNLMGTAAIAKLPDGTAYTRKEVKRKGYEVADTTYVDFRFTAKPKEAA